MDTKVSEFTPFIEWFQRRGLRVYQTQSSFWYEQAPLVLQAIPWHSRISPSEDELRKLLTDNRLLAAKYSTSLDAPLGMLSYHVVFSGSSYDISSVSASIRSKVRAGLRACEIKQIPLERYANESWMLQKDTMSRQGQPYRIAERAWNVTCQSAIGLSGFESWGAEVGGKLVAALLLCTLGDTALMIYQQCLRAYLPLKVNNALIFEVTKALTSRPGLKNIHYGLHSLDASPDIDLFKFRMGYRAYRVRQRVVLAPPVSPLFGKLIHRVVRTLSRAMPSISQLTKTEGMLRFYIQGFKPVAEQSLPEAVSKYEIQPARKPVP